MRVLEEPGAWGASPRPVVHIPGTARGPAAAVSVWCWGRGNPARGASRRPWDRWQWGSSGTVGCAWRGRALPWGGSALGDLAGDASPLPGLYGSSRGIFPEQALPAAAQMNQVIATWKYFVLIKRRARKRCSSMRAGTDEGVPGAYGDRNPADLRLKAELVMGSWEPGHGTTLEPGVWMGGAPCRSPPVPRRARRSSAAPVLGAPRLRWSEGARRSERGRCCHHAFSPNYRKSDGLKLETVKSRQPALNCPNPAPPLTGRGGEEWGGAAGARHPLLILQRDGPRCAER